MVTGHSLGACLTTVVAPWLKYDLAGAGVNAPIVPVTFAAPTAGNAAFASDFAAAFPYSLRYANSLDIVPRAWWDLDGLASIYNPCGLDCPEVAYLAIESYEALMDWTGVSYQQPQAGTRLLDGACARAIPHRTGTTRPWPSTTRPPISACLAARQHSACLAARPRRT